MSNFLDLLKAIQKATVIGMLDNSNIKSIDYRTNENIYAVSEKSIAIHLMDFSEDATDEEAHYAMMTYMDDLFKLTNHGLIYHVAMNGIIYYALTENGKRFMEQSPLPDTIDDFEIVIPNT